MRVEAVGPGAGWDDRYIRCLISWALRTVLDGGGCFDLIPRRLLWEGAMGRCTVGAVEGRCLPVGGQGRTHGHRQAQRSLHLEAREGDWSRMNIDG